MSSKSFLPAIDLRLRPSRYLAVFLFVTHGAALAALAAVSTSYVVAALLAGGIITSFVYYFRRHIQLRGARAVRRAVWTEEGDWLLTTAAAQTRTVRLLPGAYVAEKLVVLPFQDDAKRRYTVILLPDNVDARTFRQLKVRLRMTDPYRG